MLVLWLLSESPLHGYRIKQILADHAMRFWFPVQDASIYSVLRFLVRSDYAKVVRSERKGKRPQRTQYAILPRGRRYLQELLRRAWVELPSPADPFHLALAALGDLDQREIPKLLELRRAALEARIDELDARRRSAPAETLVARQRALTAAELKWIDSLKK